MPRFLQRRPAQEPEEPESAVQRRPAQEPEAPETLQAKLDVRPADDAFEREADAVAQRVVEGGSAPPISRLGGAGGQRRTAPEPAAPAPATLRSAEGQGTPLPPALRAAWEPRFGASLADVRVHTGPAAHQLSRSLNAQAFTHGRDIFFSAGRYAPDTRGGQDLLAHELAHVVQQRGGTRGVQRKAEPTKAPAAATVPPLELMGNPRPLAPPEALRATLDAEGEAPVPVRFGNMARGTVIVRRVGDGRYALNKPQAIPFTHALLRSLPGHRRPQLVLKTDSARRVEGYVGLGPPKRVARPKSLQEAIRKYPDLIGMAGFTVPNMPELTNELKGGALNVSFTGMGVNLGAFSGTLDLGIGNALVTFKGAIEVQIPGLESGRLELARDPKGRTTGKVGLGVKLSKSLSGEITVSWDGRMLEGEGRITVQGEKLSGTLTLHIMEKGRAKKLEADKKGLPPKAPRKEAKGRKPAKPQYAVFGEGELSVQMSEWLSGKAQVIVGPTGHLTVIGEITPQKEIILFPQKDYNEKLFKAEARVIYGIPVVGNVFIFGNVGVEAFAALGPAKFYNIAIAGKYSTDPEVQRHFNIKGSLNVSAAAGLKLRGEAGVGVRILAHDIKAGGAVNATAGIKAYADATPLVGYREKQGRKGEDKKGEFFIKGELDVGAQPFFELSGDVFVEVDAPWWSPVPDKRWTWPLGGKTWPLPGSFGVKAEIEHVFGAKTAPKLTFKKSTFSADKFMSDLYHDKTKAGGGGKKDRQPARWKEKNTKASPVPKPKGKGAPVGKTGPATPAKSKMARDAARGGGTADPKARTADGRTVRAHMKAAVRHGGKPPPARGVAKGAKSKGKAKPIKPPVGKGHHKQVADAAAKALKEAASKESTYAKARKAMQTRAKALEKEASSTLKKPIRMKVLFLPVAKDRKDGDIDFTIRIAPNNYEPDYTYEHPVLVLEDPAFDKFVYNALLKAGNALTGLDTPDPRDAPPGEGTSSGKKKQGKQKDSKEKEKEKEFRLLDITRINQALATPLQAVAKEAAKVKGRLGALATAQRAYRDACKAPTYADNRFKLGKVAFFVDQRINCYVMPASRITDPLVPAYHLKAEGWLEEARAGVAPSRPNAKITVGERSSGQPDSGQARQKAQSELGTMRELIADHSKNDQKVKKLQEHLDKALPSADAELAAFVTEATTLRSSCKKYFKKTDKPTWNQLNQLPTPVAATSAPTGQPGAPTLKTADIARNQFSYPDHPVTPLAAAEFIERFPESVTEDTASVLMIAAFVAEPTRDPVANVTNLLLLRNAATLEQEKVQSVFHVLSMTQAGSDPQKTPKPGDYQAWRTRGQSLYADYQKLKNDGKATHNQVQQAESAWKKWQKEPASWVSPPLKDAHAQRPAKVTDRDLKAIKQDQALLTELQEIFKRDKSLDKAAKAILQRLSTPPSQGGTKKAT